MPTLGLGQWSWSVLSRSNLSDWTTTGGFGISTELDAYQIFQVEPDKPCSYTYAVQCVKVED